MCKYMMIFHPLIGNNNFNENRKNIAQRRTYTRIKNERVDEYSKKYIF